MRSKHKSNDRRGSTPAWATALSMGLLALGWHWALALGLVVVVNVGAVVWAALQMRRLSALLKLPATQRHLTLRASAQAVAAQSLPVAADAPLGAPPRTSPLEET